MAIIVKTENPQELLKLIYKAIDDGHVKTWEYDEAKDFTHITSDGQWYNKAWLKPHIDPIAKELKLGILFSRKVEKTKLIYGVYHGRFIEMLLTHFNDSFTTVLATAQLTRPDLFTEGEKLV